MQPWRVILCASALLFGGCGRDETPRPSAPRQTAEPKPTHELPDIPDAKDHSPGKADVLVTDHTVRTRYEAPLYTQDEKVPAGALAGLCSVPIKGRVALPASQRVDVENGPLAIRDPLPGEVAYYRKAPLRTPAYITYNRRTGRYGVGGAVLVIRGITSGRRPPLTRSSFDLHGRLISNYNVRKNPWDTPTVKFCMVKDRVMFRTYDPFPSHFTFTNLATGQVVLDKKAAGFTGKKRYDTFHGTEERIFGHGVVPPHTQSPPLKEAGVICRMTCRRHPWQQGYCFVVDNPYVTVSEAGKFHIGGIPAGTWTVEVWHPTLEPLQREHTVTIEEDDTTELGVAFKLPPELQPQGELRRTEP